MRPGPKPLRVALLALCVATPVRAADPGAAPPARESVVSIENFTFKPATITIHAGATVVFTNRDDIPHSVVLVDGSARTPALDTNETARLTFATVGAHAYYCGLHPHMKGVVVVVP